MQLVRESNPFGSELQGEERNAKREMRQKSIGLAFRRARLRGRIWRESREIWGDEVLTDLQEERKSFWKEPLGEASANYLYRCPLSEKDASRSKNIQDSSRFTALTSVNHDFPCSYLLTPFS